MPSISAVIPVKNGERYLAEAVASIRRQAIAPMEIVVVDDGSTDGTAALAATLGPDVVLLRQANAGVTASRNRGVRAARGELIAFLDCDDAWTDDKLATQVPILVAHPDIAVVLGHTRRMWVAPGGDAPSFTEPELALHLGAALIRRTALGDGDAFDESLKRAEDWDWFMRLREEGRAVVVHPEVTLHYRRHGANMSNEATANGALIRMLHRSLTRRRATGEAAALPSLPTLAEYVRERTAAG